MSPAAAFALGAAVGAGAAAVVAVRVMREQAATLGRLFSFAAHEINTPVTAVNMTVLNLISGVFGELPPDQLPWLEMTREQVARLNALVGELRDLVHLHLRRDLRIAIVDSRPEEIAAEASESLRRGMAQAGVDLVIDVPADLPTVRGDEERAARSLTSLLFHARKFRVRGPVRLSAAAANGQVSFKVLYEGPQLAASEVRDSLDLLYPARHRPDQTLAATGLGLGLIRSVMALTGGDLAFTVDPSGRSTLTLSMTEAPR